jgi:hypothetical protein
MMRLPPLNRFLDRVTRTVAVAVAAAVVVIVVAIVSSSSICY